MFKMINHLERVMFPVVMKIMFVGAVLMLCYIVFFGKQRLRELIDWACFVGLTSLVYFLHGKAMLIVLLASFLSMFLPLHFLKLMAEDIGAYKE